MGGIITGRDVLLHGFTILRLWGPRVYVRCLKALIRNDRTTFLAIACGLRLSRAGRGCSRP